MSALTWAAVLHLSSMPMCTVEGMVPAFWPKVVRVESHYDPLALHDDDTGRSYYPSTPLVAEMTARALMAQGHSVGVGMSQLTARSEREFLAKFGLFIRQAFDACPNMHVGAQHYVNGALSIYQSGTATAGIANGYVQRVLSAEVKPPDLPVKPTVAINPFLGPGATGKDTVYAVARK